MNNPDNSNPLPTTGSLPGAGSGGTPTALRVVVIVLAVIGGIALLGFVGMTMGFKVKEKALLDKLKEGQKVTFEFVQESDGYVVTKVK